MQRITYYLNNVSLNAAGIGVKSAEGLIELPDLKERRKGDWKAMNGVVLDTARPFMKERTIKLNCAWLIQTNGTINNVQAAQKYVRETLLNYGQSVQLRVQFPTGVLANPLVYNVVQDKGIGFSWKFSGNDILLEFTIALIEPQPTKLVLQYKATTGNLEAALSFTAADGTTQFDIDWGNGSTDFDVTATYASSVYTVSKTHVYTNTGTYYIIVSGDIYKVNSVSQQGTNPNPKLLWTIK